MRSFLPAATASVSALSSSFAPQAFMRLKSSSSKYHSWLPTETKTGARSARPSISRRPLSRCSRLFLRPPLARSSARFSARSIQIRQAFIPRQRCSSRWVSGQRSGSLRSMVSPGMRMRSGASFRTAARALSQSPSWKSETTAIRKKGSVPSRYRFVIRASCPAN